MLAELQPWVLAYAVLLLGVAAAVVGRAVAVQRRTREAWRRFANERGLRFVEPEPAWYQGRNFHIEGQVRGVEFRLEKLVVRRGKSSRVYTLLEARGVERTSFPLEVKPNDLAARVAGFFGRKPDPLGDPRFDQRFVVRASSADRPSEVLHEALRERLLEFGPLVELTLHRDRLRLSWARLEPSPERLQRAIEIAVLAFQPPRR